MAHHLVNTNNTDVALSYAVLRLSIANPFLLIFSLVHASYSVQCITVITLFEYKKYD